MSEESVQAWIHAKLAEGWSAAQITAYVQEAHERLAKERLANERPTTITDATKMEVDSSAKPEQGRETIRTVRRMVVSSYPSMSPSAAAAPAKTPASKTEPREFAALFSSSKSSNNSSMFTSQKPLATPVVAEADMVRDGDVVPTPTRRPEKRKAASAEKTEQKTGRRTRSKK